MQRDHTLPAVPLEGRVNGLVTGAYDTPDGKKTLLGVALDGPDTRPCAFIEDDGSFAGECYGKRVYISSWTTEHCGHVQRTDTITIMPRGVMPSLAAPHTYRGVYYTSE
jgi:hypothetical protein